MDNEWSWGLPREESDRLKQICRGLTVEEVSTAVFAALRNLDRAQFSVHTEESGKTIIHNINLADDVLGGKKGESWGYVRIMPAPGGGADLRVMTSNNYDNKPAMHKAVWTIIRGQIMRLYGERANHEQTAPPKFSASIKSLVPVSLNSTAGSFEPGQTYYLPEDVARRLIQADSDIGAAKKLAGLTGVVANEPETDPQPWDFIPDYRWDRKAVELLHLGYSDPEIARKVDKAPKTVTNRLSRLRQQYPNCVPTRDKLRSSKLT